MSSLAAALIATGHRDEGLQTLVKSVKMNPGDPRAHANMGVVLVSMPGRMDEGIAELREALRIEPGDAAASAPSISPWQPKRRAQVADRPRYNRRMISKLACLLLFVGGCALAQNRVYELRTYTCNEGKLEALKTRFRDHTIAIFKRHGMESHRLLGVRRTPSVEEHADLYSGASQPRGCRKALGGIPRRSGMEEGAGRIGGQRGLVQKVESVFMSPTDFSALR